MSKPDPRTREPRSSVMLSAHVFATDGVEAVAHRVINLSATGVCIAQPDGLTPRTMVAVSIGEVEHAPAEIVWVRGGLAGLRFRKPVDLAKARRRRAGGGVSAPAAGWLGELNDAYRR